MIFKGKILLELGSNAGSVELVNYAREQGAYTIVADYLQEDQSPAKLVADEAALISTNDLEALQKLVEERHVDAIMAGVSEFNLLSAMKLCKENKLNFYCTEEQWHKIENKEQFRRLCQENNVPAPDTYYTGDDFHEIPLEKLCYPLLVKPVDASASSGVSICNSEQQLRAAVDQALKVSHSGRIIVERFVRGQEFTAHYTVVDGIAKLVCIDERIPGAVHEGNVTTLPLGRIYPAYFLDEYLELVDPKMQDLCKSIGLSNAVLFIQGLYHPEDGIHVFEAGLRPAGELPCRFLSVVNGEDFQHLLVEQALLGKAASYRQEREDPRLGGKCCAVVSIAVRGGVIGSILGMEETIQKLSSVVAHEIRYRVGQKAPDGDTLRQLALRFIMICENRKELIEDVAYINEHVTILDDKGEDMSVKIDLRKIPDGRDAL